VTRDRALCWNRVAQGRRRGTDKKEVIRRVNPLEIVYPRRWTYRIIGSNPTAIRYLVAEAAEGREYELAESNTSRTGRYVAYTLTLVVEDEEDRNVIFRHIQAHATVRYVL